MKNLQNINMRLVTLLLAVSLGLMFFESRGFRTSAAAATAPQTSPATCNLSCQAPNGGTMTLIEWTGGITTFTGEAFPGDPPRTFTFRLGYTSYIGPVAITDGVRKFYRFDVGAGGAENLVWCYSYAGVTHSAGFTDAFPPASNLTIDLDVDNFDSRTLLGVTYIANSGNGYEQRVYYTNTSAMTLPQSPSLPDQTMPDPTKWGSIQYSLLWPYGRNGVSSIGGIPTTAKGVFTTSACPTGDTTPPTITCPSNVTAALDLQQCATVVNTGTATATDNLTVLPTVTGTRSDGQPLNASYPKGVTTITWRATDEANNQATCTQTVTINCPTITMPSIIGSGGVGVFYDQGLSASPNGNYSYSVSGTLPPGLSLNPTTGRLSGTPTQSGEFGFTVMATACGCSGSRTYSITINCSNITISPASLANGAVGVSYNTTISATPVAAYSFSVISGTLPPGLSLHSSTGVISGTPTQMGTFAFRITATGSGSCLSFRDYQISVLGCTAINVVPASLSNGTVGAAYSRTVHATPAAAYNFAVTNGALPPGLSLNATTGAISGTPTQSGTFSFRITATSSPCSGYRDYSITIGCPAIQLPSLTDAVVGADYSQSLAIGPVGAYSYVIFAGSLPVGFSLDSLTGALTGKASSTGAYNFTIRANASGGCSGQRAYTLAVNCPFIIVTPGSLPAGTIGTAYSTAFTAMPSGGSYSFAVTAGVLPAGLSLNPATGLVSGTPTAAGVYNFTITVTGFGSCTGARVYTGTITGSSCPTITLPDLPGGQPGQLYSNSVTASPSGRYNYAVTAGNLPSGLTLYGSFGLIYGYPTAAGTYNFTIQATNANGCTGNRSFTVAIGAAAVN